MNIQPLKSVLGIFYYVLTESCSVRRLCCPPGGELMGAGVTAAVSGRSATCGSRGSSVVFLQLPPPYQPPEKCNSHNFPDRGCQFGFMLEG